MSLIIDIVGAVLGAGGLGLAVAGFRRGLEEWREAQRWKRAERLDAFIETFERDELLRLACQILDWTDRKVDAPGGKGTVAWKSRDVMLALRVHHDHPDAEYPAPQALIRDAMDRWLAFLHRLGAAIDSGLIDQAPAIAYFGYWLERMRTMDMHASGDANAREAMRHYVEAYGDAEAVARLQSLSADAAEPGTRTAKQLTSGSKEPHGEA